jgi:dGTPase
VISTDRLPAIVADRCGVTRSSQLGTFVLAMAEATAQTGRVGMTAEEAEALAEFRRFNYENVYLRPESRAQADAVIAVLRALVEHYASNPSALPEPFLLERGDDQDHLRTAVAWVSGMTDRFACDRAVELLGWPEEQLPRGIDV